MKTISISIDDKTLELVDRLTRTGSAKNRSQVIGQAVREYVQGLGELTKDEREARTVRQHRGLLSRQARALISQQSKP